MEQMSITRALAQLKLLDARITKEINNSKFVGLYQNRNKVIQGTSLSKDEFEKEAKADKQSIDALIKRRMDIKSAILISNAATKVTVAGEKYYVVEAIERKNSIAYDKQILDHMRRQYQANVNAVEVNNQKLNQQIENMVNTNLGSEKTSNKNDYENIARPFREENELKMSDVIGLEKEIDKLDKEIDEFLSEVDFVLSESNSKTMIEI